MSPSHRADPEDPRLRAARTKRDRTRRALLDAGLEAFGSGGWTSTMEEIAAAAGVSPTTAYNHFPTKHALLGHVYGPLLRPLVVAAERDVAVDRPMVDAVTDQVKALTSALFGQRVLAAALFCAVQEYTIRTGGPPDPADALDPRNLAPAPLPVRLLVEHGQRTGQFRTHPPALEVGAMTTNLLLIRCVNRPGESEEATVEMLLTVIFGMLRPDLLAAAGLDERPFRIGG